MGVILTLPGGSQKVLKKIKSPPQDETFKMLINLISDS